MKIISSCCNISYFMLLTWGATRPLAIIMNTNLTLLWTSLLLYINNFKVFGKSCKKLSNKFDAGERSFVTQLFTKWISLARKCKRMRYAKIIFFLHFDFVDLEKNLTSVQMQLIWPAKDVKASVCIFPKCKIYLFKFRNIFEVEVDNEADRGLYDQQKMW